MNAIYMTDQQLVDAPMTFEIAVEIIMRGNFPKEVRDKAWKVYDYEMMREELLLQQQAQMEAA